MKRTIMQRTFFKENTVFGTKWFFPLNWISPKQRQLKILKMFTTAGTKYMNFNISIYFLHIDSQNFFTCGIIISYRVQLYSSQPLTLSRSAFWSKTKNRVLHRYPYSITTKAIILTRLPVTFLTMEELGNVNKLERSLVTYFGSFISNWREGSRNPLNIILYSFCNLR